MHFCLLQRASASKGSGHHHRTQESWFRTSDKNKHLWPLQCFLQWSSGHCYSTRQRPGPDKSGHGCLLCLPEGQSSFYLFIFGLLEKDIRVGEEKKKEVSSRRHLLFSHSQHQTLLWGKHPVLQTTWLQWS